MTRYARRVDTTHAPIRREFEKLGADVWDTHACGQGWPDMVVGWRGRTVLVECKWQAPTRGPYHQGSHRETEQQRQRRCTWRGDAWIVLDNPDQAVPRLLEALAIVADDEATGLKVRVAELEKRLATACWWTPKEATT